MKQEVAGSSRFVDRICDLLKRVSYRRIESPSDKEKIFRLRYEAYIREGAICENQFRQFHDPFDDVPNVWIIGMYIDGGLASSIRLHVAGAMETPLPAMTVFPSELAPELRQGRVIVDPTRHVTDLEFSRRFPELPYLTVRSAWMAGEYFNAEYILATVRTEHRGFYRRVFGHEEWSGPKDYPTLKKPIVCMAMNFPSKKAWVEERYPFYRSSAAEREALFAVSTNPTIVSSAAVSWNVVGPALTMEEE